jgi:5'-phosphate synthase pdxT subunit
VPVGVLALQGDVEEHLAALSDLGVKAGRVRREEDLSGIDGMIIPGGESTTLSMLLESSGLAGPVAEAVASGMPVFGTCAGLILLAREVSDGRPDQRCFGAVDLVARRNGYGRQLDSFECELPVSALGARPFHAVFIRAPVVESAGPDVEVLATLDTEGIPGNGQVSSPVILRQGNALVATFHPELTGDRRIHELFVSMLGDHRRDQ